MPSSPQRRSLIFPVRALTWLGNQGTRAIAALVFIAIAAPPLGKLLRPFVTESIFLLLCISFMRVDIGALRGHVRRPGIVLSATIWTTVAVPLMIGSAGHLSGLDARSPDLFLALMLQGVASPTMASPALAALMGLDATLVLITLVTSTALVPLTAPLFAYLFLGATLSLAPLALGLKLAAMLAGALLVASLIRWSAGAAAIERHRAPIDGLNILFLFVFAAAVMGGVAAGFLTNPLKMVGLIALAFAVFFVLLGATTLIFRGVGRERAISLGLMVSLRNMGLIVAATDGVLPGTAWLYLALNQFPIYLAPQLLKPVVTRWTARQTAAVTAEPADA
jgi:predicted Na+-dependent transporter